MIFTFLTNLCHKYRLVADVFYKIFIHSDIYEPEFSSFYNLHGILMYHISNILLLHQLYIVYFCILHYKLYH
jgi:hypothetical protein